MKHKQSYYNYYMKHTFVPDKDQDVNKFHGKKASLETRTKIENERKYVRRSNVCSTCFVVRSVKTGECNCT